VYKVGGLRRLGRGAGRFRGEKGYQSAMVFDGFVEVGVYGMAPNEIPARKGRLGNGKNCMSDDVLDGFFGVGMMLLTVNINSNPHSNLGMFPHAYSWIMLITIGLAKNYLASQLRNAISLQQGILSRQEAQKPPSSCLR
jgi:hypothetical protein